jgi:hypothetical protein
MADGKAGTRGAISLRDVDPDALKVVRKLVAGGFEAYLVGGCVRDLYLKRRPKDFDVATSATPEALRRTFRNCRIIGRRFKLAHVFFGPKVIETSTFRTTPMAAEDDPLITHDNEWGTVEDDARRRDFTINGLFYDLDADAIVDFVDGLSDLDRGVIRTIGDPLLRFQEDPVRMIRAIKFAARLDFTIEIRHLDRPPRHRPGHRQVLARPRARGDLQAHARRRLAPQLRAAARGPAPAAPHAQLPRAVRPGRRPRPAGALALARRTAPAASSGSCSAPSTTTPARPSRSPTTACSSPSCSRRSSTTSG